MGIDVRRISVRISGALFALAAGAASCSGDALPPDESPPEEVAASAPAPVGRPVRAAPPAMAPGLRAAFVRAAQEGASALEYGSFMETAARARADNPEHRFESVFEPIGVTVRGPSGAFELSLATERIGCADSAEEERDVVPEARGNRVEYQRGGAREWYLNGPLGLEQGFTLEESPGCDGALQVDVLQGGDVRAELVDPDGDGRGDRLALRDREGQSVLDYRELHVEDAAGRILPAWLSLSASPGGQRISIHVDGEGASYPIEIDPLIATQTAKLVAPDAQSLDHFGQALAIEGDTALVGSPLDDNANGVDAGAVYVFLRSAGVWSFSTKILASVAGFGDNFGAAVALSGDTAVIGAPQRQGGSGAVYMLVRSGNVWTQQATFGASLGTEHVGSAVAISGDTALVGAPTRATVNFNNDAVGLVRFYGRTNGVWTMVNEIFAPNNTEAYGYFGSAVAIVNNTAAVGWPQHDTVSGADAGEVEIYVKSGGVWAFSDKLVAADAAAGDAFGSRLAMSGETVVVGAPQDDNAKGVDAGAAYVFDHSTGLWVSQGKLLASDGVTNDWLGNAVAIHGATIALGAPYHDSPGSNAGSAYLYTRSGNAWSQAAELGASDAAGGFEFGCSVALSLDTAMVGAQYATAGGADGGAAYVFGLMLAQGDACVAGAQCPSGQCVDGVCCNTACAGGASDCQACSVAAGAIVNGVCAPIAAGAPCRPAAGVCDSAEACDGVNGACPADAKIAVGTPCRAAAGVCDAAEACDGNNNACPVDSLSPSGTPCRPAAGACDVAETCTGNSAACPADGKIAVGTPCRPAAGLCDAPEACDGSNNACPADAKIAVGTPCRPAAGLCDAPEACDGNNNACPADAKIAVGTPCRPAAGICDAAEVCDGNNNACPVDAKMPVGTECRPAAGFCDVPETCNGAGNACPPDVLAAAGTECRPAGGACDLAEVCAGNSASCPPDTKVSAGTPCRAPAGLCDAPETCDGANNTCPADAKMPAGSPCRVAAGLCDLPEACDGAADVCPADSKVAAGVECRASAGDCDVAESCDGGGDACPQDGSSPDGTPCAGGSCKSGVCEPGMGGTGGMPTGGTGGDTTGGAGGTGGTGGMPTGGTGGDTTGGAGGTGGDTAGGTGGVTTSSSTETGKGGSSGEPGASGGCGCRTAGGDPPSHGSAALLVVALGLSLRRARRRMVTRRVFSEASRSPTAVARTLGAPSRMRGRWFRCVDSNHD